MLLFLFILISPFLVYIAYQIITMRKLDKISKAKIRRRKQQEEIYQYRINKILNRK